MRDEEVFLLASRKFSIPGVPNLPFKVIGPKRVSPPQVPVTGPHGEPLEPAKPSRNPSPSKKQGDKNQAGG